MGDTTSTDNDIKTEETKTATNLSESFEWHASPDASLSVPREIHDTYASLREVKEYRWIVNVSEWNPSPQEWEHALAHAQPEEQARIRRFRFPIDAKRSLIGRLLMRRVVHVHSGMPWSDIQFKRTQSNKPYWSNPSVANFSFNISHHSKFVILVAHSHRTVGCDVMSIEITSRDKDQNKFLSLMRDSFTADEWAIIQSRPSEPTQLSQFFTFWTLKESFIKNTGTGLFLELKRMNFFFTNKDKTREFDQMSLEVIRQGDEHDIDASVYTFEHFRLDDQHTAAVCLGPPKPARLREDNTSPAPFQDIQPSSLIPPQTTEARTQAN